ncbi:MAG: carboxyl transferase [Ruminococcaceae bacterium]|nr:carboxyl transferase [Oscillospiraceae bacterium]
MEKSISTMRLQSLFDGGEFTPIDAFAKSTDGDAEVDAGFGLIGGNAAYAFAQNADENSGAITVAACAKIKKVYELAEKTGCPVIGIYDSNGVKLTEGFEVLSAYGDLVKASSRISGVIPQISIIAGACIGTSALIANMADVVIALEDADFYLTAPSEQTVNDSSEDGIVDIIVKDIDEAVNKAACVLSVLPSNNLEIGGIFEAADSVAVPSEDMDYTQIANAIADSGSVIELKSNYGCNVFTALASVGGEAVGIISFGEKELCVCCAYKAEALVKLCDAFSIPIITIANGNGFKHGKESQVLISATKLVSAYASATCPKISLVTKEAVGGAYIILAGKGANADLTFAWDNAVISPLETESAVAFLWGSRLADGESREELIKEYKETVGSAFTAAACGAVDDVFTPEETRAKLFAVLDMLAGKRETTIPRKHSVK